jgi:hypothetical protein
MGIEKLLGLVFGLWRLASGLLTILEADIFLLYERSRHSINPVPH